MKIYTCDGKKECCYGEKCYLNGGTCYSTTDPDHDKYKETEDAKRRKREKILQNFFIISDFLSKASEISNRNNMHFLDLLTAAQSLDELENLDSVKEQLEYDNLLNLALKAFNSLLSIFALES